MTDYFTWKAHSTISGGGEFRTSRAKFGDGYSQDVADGLNSEEQKWTVIVSGQRSEIVNGPLQFIRDKAGAEAFYWTPPAGVQGYYICKRYNPQDQGGGYFTLSMEFEQVFRP